MRVYEEHNARVRALVPREGLLEFQPKDGWGPLCAFLGKGVPEEGFPRVSEVRVWREAFGLGKGWARVERLVGQVGVEGAGVVIVAVVWGRILAQV